MILPIKIVFSPSRAIIDFWKNRSDGSDEEKKKIRGDRLRKWSKWLFRIELILMAVLLFVSIFYSFEKVSRTVSYAFLLYSYSRINEIAYAFLLDPISKLDKNSISSSDIIANERVVMAMRSYYGLIFNFAVVYFFLQVEILRTFSLCLFDKALHSFIDAVYFSVVTITTLGYGEITPIHWASKVLVVYEVLAGFLIIVLAIAVYIFDLGKGKNA